MVNKTSLKNKFSEWIYDLLPINREGQKILEDLNFRDSKEKNIQEVIDSILPDRIIASGEANGWYWRKWRSGIAEARITRSLTIQTEDFMNTNSSAGWTTGHFEEPGVASLICPITFDVEPCITLSPISEGEANIVTWLRDNLCSYDPVQKTVQLGNIAAVYANRKAGGYTLNFAVTGEVLGIYDKARFDSWRGQQ